MNPIFGAVVGSVFQNVMSQLFNRADYKFTHDLTAAPQQVKEFKEAGLNPALAYGQVSAPQGQTLGNYQQDMFSAMRNIEQIPLLRKMVESQQASIDTEKANARKINAEAEAQEFLNSHQEQDYKLDFEFKGLRNIGQSYQNAKIALETTWQEYENKIHEIDLKYHDKTMDARLKNIVADTGLKLALSKTENILRDWRLKEIQQNIRNLIDMRGLMASQSSFYRNESLLAHYRGLLTKTESLYTDWLTKNNTDFSKMNRRQVWSLIGRDVSSGLGAAIGAGTAIYLSRGKALLPGKSFPSYTTPVDNTFSHIGE